MMKCHLFIYMEMYHIDENWQMTIYSMVIITVTCEIWNCKSPRAAHLAPPRSFLHGCNLNG